MPPVTFICLECGLEMKKPKADGSCKRCGGTDLDLG
jgi:Zn finger protein HypA/HybF involved in hydrogenase expression